MYSNCLFPYLYRPGGHGHSASSFVVLLIFKEFCLKHQREIMLTQLKILPKVSKTVKNDYAENTE